MMFPSPASGRRWREAPDEGIVEVGRDASAALTRAFGTTSPASGRGDSYAAGKYSLIVRVSSASSIGFVTYAFAP